MSAPVVPGEQIAGTARHVVLAAFGDDAVIVTGPQEHCVAVRSILDPVVTSRARDAEVVVVLPVLLEGSGTPLLLHFLPDAAAASALALIHTPERARQIEQARAQTSGYWLGRESVMADRDAAARLVGAHLLTPSPNEELEGDEELAERMHSALERTRAWAFAAPDHLDELHQHAAAWGCGLTGIVLTGRERTPETQVRALTGLFATAAVVLRALTDADPLASMHALRARDACARLAATLARLGPHGLDLWDLGSAVVDARVVRAWVNRRD